MAYRGRKGELWFAFNGVSCKEHDVYLVTNPDIPVPAQRGESVEIAGRDGSLWVTDGSYYDSKITLTIELGRLANRNAIAHWLDGYGNLVLSEEPDYCWKGRCVSGFTLAPGVYLHGRQRATVEFDVQPFMYLRKEPTIEITNSIHTFQGHGSIQSQPIITIYGNGDFTLMVNGVSVFFNDIDDHITLDCEAMMAYKDGVNWSPQVTLLSNGYEEWPYLLPEGATNLLGWVSGVEYVDDADGDDTVSSDDSSSSVTPVTSEGSVTRIVIKPNWRWR